MDLMCHFPPEIIEKILSYLNTADLKNCIQVSRLWQRNASDLCNWKKLCIKNNWIPNSFTNYCSRSLWKQCFWLNFNWYYGFYDKFDLEVISSSTTRLATDLVIRVFQDRVEIWSFEVTPQLEQTIILTSLLNSTVRIYKEFILKQEDAFLQIHRRLLPEKKYELYKEINLPNIQKNSESNNETSSKNKGINEGSVVLIKINEQYITVTLKGNQNIFCWDMKKDNEWIIAYNNGFVFRMEIESHMLYIVTLDMPMCCYKIKKFDINKKVWHLEVVLFENTSFGINSPEIWVNACFVMSIAEISQFQNRCLYSPLKAWNHEGSLVDWEFPKYARKPYFHCCLKDNNIIFTLTESTIVVWKPHEKEITRRFNVDYGFDDVTLVPGNLVAISYRNLIQIWDWERGRHLYHIDCNLRIVNKCIVTINEQFYIQENGEEIAVVKFNDKCRTVF